jgi:tetratricopeptide (TPR) repeat protein
MKRILFLALLFCTIQADAQLLTMPADGGSTKAFIGERIGLTDVVIHYGRPAVRGREGKIWGKLVHEGFVDNGGSEPMPWRAGANETTTIEFSTDVIIEGTAVKAGKYGLFVAYYPTESIVILSKNNNSWGSYFYKAAEDVARIKVKPVKLNKSVERLTYKFKDQDDSTAVVVLAWEKLSIPFKIRTELQKLQMASFEKELKTEKGFNSQAWLEYADYLLEHNLELDKALRYANSAANSDPGFMSYMTKAEILEKMGEKTAADSATDMAMQYGNPTQSYYYALGMLNNGKNAEALKLMQMNLRKNPKSFISHLGIAKAYKANKMKEEALSAAKDAMSLARSDDQKQQVQELIDELNKK